MSTINGTSDSETLFGTDDTDRIYTNGGYDIVYGGDGNDEINGYITNLDTMAYYYYLSAERLLIYGQDGDDVIVGGQAGGWLYGGNGNDTIYGRAGDTKIYGGDGDDFLSSYLQTGENELYGDGGNDTIHGGTGNDVLDGGIGDDYITGYEGNDTLLGGLGNDSLYGNEGNNILRGGDGDDFISTYAESGTNELYGDAGDDQLYGGAGDDTLTGGAGYDELYGGAGDDTYYVTDLEDYIYDSSGSDTAIVSVSFAKIPTSIETVTYINGALALPYWISALVSDSGNGSHYKNLLGATKTFSYSFPDSIPAYNTDTEDANGYTGLNVAQQYNSIALLNTLPDFIDVNVSKTSNHDSLNTISIALNDQVASAGYAQYPFSDSYGSDIFLDNVTNNSTLNPGTYGAYTITHELGHALGLKHPFDEPDASGNIPDPPYLQGDEDQTAWTMMSYTDTSNEYKLEFSELDIAALQYLYGPSATARTGDDTYYYDATSANFIWDGSGEDTLSASNSNVPVTIYLTPGYWGYGGNTKAETITTAGQITVNFGTTIENLIGSIYADTLTGNGANNEINGSNGDDIIYGGAGNDALDYTLVNGNDTLYGGPGNDTYYVYSSSGSDTFIEYLDEGYDRIFTSISYSIKNISNIENLFSFNSIEEDIELTGNSLNNYIKSSDGNCVLDGGLGSDTAWYGWDYAYGDCSIYIENGDLKVRKGNGSIDILKNFGYISFSDRTIDLSTASITTLDSTYSLTAVSSKADEGNVAEFSLVTTGVEADTAVTYTLSGVSASDLVSNSLTGTATVSTSGTTIISLPLAADALTEGAETLTITLDDSPGITASLTVIDTSISSSYKLSAVYDSRDEGSTAYFSLV
ncbi:hypothetical protein N9X92_04655, partial [Gammaproteobacteria bacterium]|nr:hypothetical protein [Gammaproteobacteria bacterium]